MSYHPPSTQISASSKVHPPDVQNFLDDLARRYGVSDTEEIAHHVIRNFGTFEVAMDKLGKSFAFYDQLLNQPPPAGQPEPLLLGRKPVRGETVYLTKLRHSVSLRIWGAGLSSENLYCFDFVSTNHPSQYMKTPSNIHIEAIGSGGMSEGLVHSIEVSMNGAMESTLRGALDPSRLFDPKSETYLILEGTHIRVSQNQAQYNVRIPVRQPNTFATLEARTF